MARLDAMGRLHRLAEELHFFQQGSAVIFLAAHGCLDVLGGLESEAGGTMAQMALPAQVAVGFQRRSDAVLRVRSAQIVEPVGESDARLPLTELAGSSAEDLARHLLSLTGSGWAAGMAALLWQMERQGMAAGVLRGANILIHSDVPMGAGQSSSTALLAAVARAITDAWGNPFEPLALAQAVASAEALVGGGGLPLRTPLRGHVISALTALHRREARPQVLRYSARPHTLVGPVPLPADVRMLALDTGVRYTSARATLDEVRAAAAMGLRIIDTIYLDLGQEHTPLGGYLTNTSPLLYRQYFRALLPRRLRGGDFVRTYGSLPEELAGESAGVDGGGGGGGGGDSGTSAAARVFRVRIAVDHLIAEHEHAEQFLQAMEELADAGSPHASSRAKLTMDEGERQRTLQRAGRLLLASHHSYRLRLELSCREADWLVDRLMEAGPDRGIFGARITGCGGGGTVAVLADRTAGATEALLEAMKSYNQLTGVNLGIAEA